MALRLKPLLQPQPAKASTPRRGYPGGAGSAYPYQGGVGGGGA